MANYSETPDAGTLNIGSTDRLVGQQDRMARSLPRRHFFNEMPDKGLFAFVAVFGFPLIIALKLYDYDPDWIAGGAVAFMLVYGLIAYRMPSVQLRTDRLGDNFYYLGFIYTLASMSAALLQLRRGSDTDALLGSFGIALVTTIVGVAGRVLFVQLRSEIDEVEEETRRDLVAVSSDLRAQLSVALRDFETFHTGVMQATAEKLGRAVETAEAQTDKIGQAAQAVGQRMTAAFDQVGLSAHKMADAVEKVASATDRLVDRIDNLKDPSEELRRQAEVITGELRSIVLRLGDTMDQLAGVSSSRQRKRRWYWPF